MNKFQNMKILAVFLSVVMLVSTLVVPASAADSGSFIGGWSSANFWDSAYSSMETPGYGDEVLKALGTLTSVDACASSASGVHSGSAVSIEKPTSGRSGRYYVHCRCDSCNAGFTVGVTENELKAAYNSYVSNLPASGFDSDGSLCVFIKPSYMRAQHYPGSVCYNFYSPSAGMIDSVCNGVSVSFNESLWSCQFLYPNSNSHEVRYYFSFTVPVTGIYSFENHYDISYSVVDSSGNSVSLDNTVYPTFSNNSYSSGDVLTSSCTLFAWNNYSCSFNTQFNGYILARIIPSSSLTSTYEDVTRPSSTVVPLGYIDDSGNSQVILDTQLVNEAGGVVYNPVTGNSINIDGWTYDYETRTYDGVTSDGMQWAVTYGDGDITLVEGDKTYNIYYLVQDTSAEDCQHEYTSSITQAAACMSSGVETYTCSKCGDTYTKSIPATGHSWQILRKVNTEYDEEGNLVTQGYTIYECSVCGEQYKDSDGVGPPASSGDSDTPSTIGGLFEKLLSGVGSVVGGIVKGILSLLTQAVDALAGIGELFAHFVENVVGLFGGFTDFLSAVFPFLPEEFFTIFSLGMILLVAAAVLRKFLN